MIIDCHGHYTTTPPAVGAWRDRQVAARDGGVHAFDELLTVTDDELRLSVASAQMSVQAERGIDRTLFSPRASWMAHHVGDEAMSRAWTELQNDLIARLCDLFPAALSGVAQLPQSSGAPIDGSVRELRRTVGEAGFVGCNVNPDPSGGHWAGPPLWDRYWWPLWEALQELDVPAMLHVSAATNDNLHTTASHYLGADTTAFTQLLSSGFVRDFPGLRFIVPHGGGAVPYHWGRFKGLAVDNGWDFDGVLEHVWFDTCVYHQAGIDLLVTVVPAEKILFGSETLGAVRGQDPDSGHHWDDTRRYLDAAPLSHHQRRDVLAGNALRVFPRLQLAEVSG